MPKQPKHSTQALQDPIADPVDLVQLLTPEGERVEHPDYSIDISDAEIAELYRDLVLVRRLDVEATALQRQGEIGMWPPLLGQEAAQVGAARAMQKQDMAFPGYREHGVGYIRGLDPVHMTAFYRGASLGGWDPEEFGFSIYTIVIGNQNLHAVGYAQGIQRDGLTGDRDDAAAVVAFFGDGASSQGDVNEAFVFAAVCDAPVVFFCQNNQWAISEPNERQFRIPLYQRARGFGFPGVRVDGNDVLASLAVSRAALERARSGQGPTLIEAYTYRMGAHTTSDDPTRYRLSAELEAWKLKDPIERVKSYLVRHSAVDKDFFDGVEADADALAVHIRKGTLEMSNPEPSSMFDTVYVEKTPQLQEQGDFLAAYLASFEGSH